MEERFGHDFSKVRIHNDVKATESAKAVNALAYTVGSNIVFGSGQHAPQSNTGKQLIAHELAHVRSKEVEQIRSHQREIIFNARQVPEFMKRRQAQVRSLFLKNGVPM